MNDQIESTSEGQVEDSGDDQAAAAAAAREAEIERRYAAQDAHDDKTRSAAITQLREEWGREGFETRRDAVRDLLASMPPVPGVPREDNVRSLLDQIEGARLADGTLVLNTPGVFDRLATLEKINRTRRENYQKYVRNESMQAQERELISELEALIRSRGRGAAPKANGRAMSKTQIAGRIAALERFMRENRSAYNASEAAQKELLDLYAARAAH